MCPCCVLRHNAHTWGFLYQSKPDTRPKPATRSPTRVPMCWGLAPPRPCCNPLFYSQICIQFLKNIYIYIIFGATQASESNHTGFGFELFPPTRPGLLSDGSASSPGHTFVSQGFQGAADGLTFQLSLAKEEKSYPAMFSDTCHSEVPWREVAIGFCLCNKWRNWGTQGDYGSSESHSEVRGSKST